MTSYARTLTIQYIRKILEHHGPELQNIPRHVSDPYPNRRAGQAACYLHLWCAASWPDTPISPAEKNSSHRQTCKNGSLAFTVRNDPYRSQGVTQHCHVFPARNLPQYSRPQSMSASAGHWYAFPGSGYIWKKCGMKILALIPATCPS